MTEQEWLACDHPSAPLAFVARQAGDRKVRLFASACCRRVWHLLHDERSRKGIEMLEQIADGQDPGELVQSVIEAAHVPANEWAKSESEANWAAATAAAAATSLVTLAV